MRFKASETFWRNFYLLNSQQKESTRKVWAIFKANPFDPRLRAQDPQPFGCSGRDRVCC
jgi:hypothetical protein